MHLYLYLDGQPLTYLPADGSHDEERLTFRARTQKGPHTIRALLERHDPPPDSQGPWTHRTRVPAEAFEFFVDGEGPWRLEIAWEYRSDPASWSFWSGGARRAGSTAAGGAPSNWPSLCEDLEADRAAFGSREPSWVARELRDCVRWAALWPPDPRPPSRAAILERLRRYGYRPIPRGARASGG